MLIVRGDDGVLRAFQNACRHRGNALCVGTGSGLRELKCGYHGWTWDLAGHACSRVPTRKGFGSLHLSDYPLLPARVDTWEDFVFVNLDLGHRCHCSTISRRCRTTSRGAGLCDFHCNATLTIEVDANWKTIADGFSETYHIQGLHPELLRCVDDIHAPQQIWGHAGKSRPALRCRKPAVQRLFDRPGGVGRLRRHPGWPDGRGRRNAVPAAAERGRGETVQDADRRADPRVRSPSSGVDLDWADTDEITRLHQYNVFPNMSTLATADQLTLMCSRPGADPDCGELVMFSMTRMPPGSGAEQAGRCPHDGRASAHSAW